MYVQFLNAQEGMLSFWTPKNLCEKVKILHKKNYGQFLRCQKCMPSF